MQSEFPFMLLFEEIPQGKDEVNLERHYNEDEGLSYVVDNLGNRVPFVTHAAITMGVTQTGTATKATEDTPDSDYVKDRAPIGVGTRTVTEVAREETDSDKNL